jgi:hypothetical protein
MTRAIYRLPDGSETYDPERFEREWTALYEPLEVALGVRIIGFDPGLLMADAGKPNAPAFTIPLWFARRVVRLIQTAPTE